jgi:hypothetical protein
LANCAANPETHRYFFSTRFHLEPFVNDPDESCLLIMLNLSYSAPANLMEEKLNVSKVLKSLPKTASQARIAAVQRNLGQSSKK